ncbi:alpha/beta fold hydrolase [Tahibacter caeni]|uniref:alpha/beta fold hydrolase n=1 Tax=Tahibacter caeni TaxID=1453545 RepID=UPI00214884A9|nr:alpha/beta fold hydrolase [Tahibacter caeni]
MTTPTLAIHGAGGGAWEWAIWQRVWQAQARSFVVPELMPAAAGLARTGLDDYVAQARAAARALLRPCLIGASLGGLIALALAKEVEASALVLVDALPPLGVAPRPPAKAVDGDIVPWASRRRFASTQRALPDADAPTQHYAFRRWRDESAAVLREAADGLAVTPPRCPVLVIAAELDESVPGEASRTLAQQLGAAFWPLRASHVGLLVGRRAADAAAHVLAWTQAVTLTAIP